MIDAEYTVTQDAQNPFGPLVWIKTTYSVEEVDALQRADAVQRGLSGWFLLTEGTAIGTRTPYTATDDKPTGIEVDTVWYDSVDTSVGMMLQKTEQD